MYETMSSDTKTPLYLGQLGSDGFLATLRLTNLETINGWTNKSFSNCLLY